MATLPSASVAVDPTASAPAGGANLLALWAPVATDPDMIPRLYGSADAIVDAHGYSEGVEYAAMHIAATGFPVLFSGMPINTAGAVSRTSTHGNTGTSVPSVVAGGDGFLAEHDGIVRVVKGGTIGTSQIKLELSLDGGKSFLAVRLGTATSFTLPNVNGTVSFAAGTLVDGDEVLEWHGSGPLPATSDLATVRTELASRSFRFRDALLCGDLPNSAAADAVVAQANAYATSNKRHVGVACSVPDRLPQAAMSRVTVRMTGAPALTFAEVGATGDTITRATGSWLADGFVVGDTITITGSGSNNITAVIASLSATVITLGSEDLAAEVTSAATIVGSPTLTFAEVGGTGDTITRSRGSWLTDGFRAGDLIDVTGTASNNVTNGVVATVTATVLTLGGTDLAAESIASSGVTLTAGETKAQWMTRVDDAFASVDAQPRIALGAGRGTFPSPYSGWHRRVPSTWIAAARAYQHDIHVAEWRKDLGSIGGLSLEDANGDPVEWDDRADGGAGSDARFTTLRTWANGPEGAFVALSLTRAGDGQLASLRPNQTVINTVCNTVQLATENAIGRSVPLNADGTATSDFLKVLAAEVNAALELEILQSRGEGPRASSCVWTPNAADIYNVPEPTTNGTVRLVLNGITHTFATRVQVIANGQ
jgi:hypothetical protein